jgi:hypothetical protein
LYPKPRDKTDSEKSAKTAQTKQQAKKQRIQRARDKIGYPKRRNLNGVPHYSCKSKL